MKTENIPSSAKNVMRKINEKVLTATVTLVPFGIFEIEGLMLETEEFGIALQQSATLFSVPQNNAQRDFKALLGEGFQFLKISAKRAERQNRPEKALTLADFEKLLFELSLKGNRRAIEMARALIGLSLTQLFADAFGQKFEKEERQAWLSDRQKSKDAFWDLEQAIDGYLLGHPDKSDNYRKWVYLNCQDTLNRHLFGKCAAKIREELQVTNLLRDHYGRRALRHLESIQSLASRYILKSDVEPKEACEKAISEFAFGIISYKEDAES
ncbi:MAG: hypothetical protein KME30_19010 [Iphinoe sp. HA4291-MV1]|jgi:hypothetical protein|nr:hypothetical protein [Iphinoe sp. HA4291-MV1]